MKKYKEKKIPARMVSTYRGTVREKAHINIYADDVHIGYIIKEDSKFRVVGQNWWFCPNNVGIDLGLHHTPGINKKQVVTYLLDFCKQRR